MLVRLVSAVLQRFLGHYVENLDTERLSYSLGYSGNVVLTDLWLKADALSHIFGSPLRLASGRIARIQLSIPLTQLRSQPWCITIEDIELIINPSASHESSDCGFYASEYPESSEDASHEIGVTTESRKAYLERLESRWWHLVREGGLIDAVATTSPTDSSWWSYGVSLIYGIVSTLQVEIRNVHFAFVDDKNLIGRNFAWGMRLEGMTVQATDDCWNAAGRTTNRQIEFKSIDVVGLSVYYFGNAANESTRQERFLIPPSQFSVHLLRRTTPEPLTSESTPRIEVEAQLTTLQVVVSHGVLVYSRQLVDFLKRQTVPQHRPKGRPTKQPAAWWRYAAGELVAGLRRYRIHRYSDLALQHLADAAALNNRYVRAYQAHLLRGLGFDQDEQDQLTADDNHETMEVTMSLDRVALLRQVAMQRAARLLKQRRLILSNEPKDHSFTVSTQPSQSWCPTFLSSTAPSSSVETTGSAGSEALEESEVPRPWRLWWWFSSAPAAAKATTESSVETETSASSSEAALILLNELVAARDVGQILTRDRLFCRITARMDIFQLRLMEVDQNLCSLNADNLQLCVETRPREESLHFNARLHSLVVQDERCRIDSQGRSQRPLFPTVISPLPQTASSSDPSALVSSRTDLFQLDYISSRPTDEDPTGKSTPSASLNIRTDPLRVVCQPELFIRVMRHLYPSAKGKSTTRIRSESSPYSTLKSQTEANLRAALHTVEKVDEEGEVGGFISTTTSSDTPESTSLSSASVGLGAATSSRLRINLDIAAPRILLAERLWPTTNEESAPSPHLLGVICDLGRFRLSNWRESIEENQCDAGRNSSFNKAPIQQISGEMELRADGEAEDSEESEAFATPCGTPSASEDESSLMRQGFVRRRRLRRTLQLQLYETYFLELNEFRILAGRLDELQVSGLWSDLLPHHSNFTTEDGRHIAQVASQVNLVDRFSLAIWITRRVVSMASLRAVSASLPSPPPTIPTDLPGLLISLEQRYCVFRLSDSRLSALRSCVGAITTMAAAAAEEVAEISEPVEREILPLPRSVPSKRISPLFEVSSGEGIATESSQNLRRTIVVTFTMQELILQLDARGRPLAEFRLVSTAAKFNRFTNVQHSMTAYEVCLQVHSLTVADALCGLGGDFDLLAASHRDVRLDTLSGSLNVTNFEGQRNSSPRSHSVINTGGKEFRNIVTRPFYDPIGEEGNEDSSTALIRVKYFQTTAVKKTNRRIDVKFRHLDLLGNLNTLLELMAFFRNIVPYSEPECESTNTPTQSNVIADNESGSSEDETDNYDNLEMSISIERLSLVLICVKTATSNGDSKEYIENDRMPVVTAERLATITLLGANFLSLENHKDLRVSLAGLQALDLSDVEQPSSNGVQHRHIFVAGRCLDPELSDTELTWSAAKSVFTLTAHRKNTSGYHVELDVTSPVYVHNPRALHEISTWLSNLYRWSAVVDALARQLADSAMQVEKLEQQRKPLKTTFSLSSLYAVFEQPVVVLPAGPASPKVLIARLGRLTLRSDSSDSTTKGPFYLAQLIVAQASLAAFDIAVGVPRVRGTSKVVQAMLVLAHYLRLIHSSEEHYVLEDISADLMLKREVLHKRPGRESDSEAISWPDDFDSSELSFPFNEEVDTDAEGTSEDSLESWITISTCLTQPLHMRLSKVVYHQILQTLDNLTYFEDELIQGRGRKGGKNGSMPSQAEVSEHKSSSTIKETPISASSCGLALRFRMPRIVVETFAEMGGETHPLGLTRLTLSEFFIAASARMPDGLTHIEATLASLLLENLLPDYCEENRYLLFSHLPKSAQSQVIHRRRRPRVDSCPNFSEDGAIAVPAFSGLGGVHSRNLKRPSLSEKNGRSRTPNSKSSSTKHGHLCQPPGGTDVNSTGADQFVRLRVLLVDKNNPFFSSRYKSTLRFVDVAFSSLTCYLSQHPWILLIDFLGLGSPITACDNFDGTSSTTQHSTDLPNSEGRVDSFAQSINVDPHSVTLTVTSLSVATFSLLFDTVPPDSSPLLRASTDQLRVLLTNYNRSIQAGGEWMHLVGRLAAVSVHDLTPTGRRLYSQRFLTKCVSGSDGEGDYLIFTFTKYQLPDPEANRRSEDGKLELRLAPAYYVHTQEFLETVINTLDRFLQYQDFMNRVRASSEGYKVRQGAPISMRLRLNIKAEAPTVVLPISADSKDVLVCNLGTLTTVNDFCWHTDSTENKEVSREGDQPQKPSACKYCTSGIWWSDEYKHTSSKGVMTQEFYHTNEATPDSGNDNVDSAPCLIDRIKLSLEHIEIYMGKRHDIEKASQVKSSQMLDFGAFCILPESPALTEPFGLTAVVDRNLCGAQELHAVPDWRLSACIRTLAPIRIGLREYMLLRGILAHNISAASSSSSASGVAGNGTSGWSAIPTNLEDLHTRRPYHVLAFTLYLEDVSICLSVPSGWPSQRHLKAISSQDAPFCRLDLTQSRLTYDSFSCGRHIIDLSCSVVTFVDTRFEDSLEPQNLFPVILSSLPTHHDDMDENSSRIPSPQFRVTQVVTPAANADAGGINMITTTTNSSMTYNLRSMRLILALDWLVDLHRFLTTEPTLPLSSDVTLSHVDSNKERSLCDSHKVQVPQGISDLRVFSDQTEFVFMQNLAQADTNTVVLTGAMCFLLRSGGSLSQALVHFCLHGVGLHTFHDCLDYSRAVIIEPTDLTVALLPPQVLSKRSPPAVSAGLQDLATPRASLEIQTSTIRTHFSYNDSLLFLSLLDSIREQALYAFGSNTATDIVPTFDITFDASVAKIVEMGFSAQDALHALQSTAGQIDAAIALLLSPSKAIYNDSDSSIVPPGSRIVSFLRNLIDQLTPHVSEISFHSGFSLCLIDDCIDADVPLAEVKISDISLKWNLMGWAVGRVMGRLSANYYNRDLSALEPAIEPFLGVCDWRLHSEDTSMGDCAIIEVHSPDVININLTVALVRLTHLMITKIRSPHLKRRRPRAPFMPFCLSNRTGETLRFKKVTSIALTLPIASSGASSLSATCDDESVEWTVVEPGATVHLPFQSPLAATGRGQGHVQGSRSAKTPRLLIQADGWTPAYPIALDRLGVFSRIIRLQRNENLSLVPATRLVIEIVRRGSAQNLVIVRSGLTLTNRLSPHLTLEVGLARLPTSTSTAPVSVMKSGLRVAFGETEALPLSLAARRENGERLCFRPILIGPDGSDDTSTQPVSLFDWSRQLKPEIGACNGRMKVVTSFDEAMDWRRLLKPGDFEECAMSCRCLKSGSEIGLYSATTASAKRALNSPSESQRTSSWQFCVTAVRDEFPPDPIFREGSVVLPGHHLTVGPVLRIVNLLPCEMTYFLEGTPIRGRLPPNKAASVLEVSCADVVRFGVHLENFQTCETIHIPQTTFSDTVLITLYDTYKRPLQLKAEVCTRPFGARHVTISAVCWLINHSGLPLVFAAQAPSSLASVAEWQTPNSAEHRALAAGQSEEQEIARLASPLLFSPFSIGGTATPIGTSESNNASVSGAGGNISSSWSLQVRLGALCEPSDTEVSWIPRWSAPVTLDKNGGELRLRLKASHFSTASRPDLLYSIGVEIRKGAGLHASTTIVTFVPRFLISNQTNFQLQYAQRFCLDSKTHKPLDIYPQCNLPFHWARQDLDQLLCFRALISGGIWPPGHQNHRQHQQTPDVSFVATNWSGALQIDSPRSYHLMLRLPSGSTSSSPSEPLFLRVNVVLRGGTLLVIISDATHLPPPYRIENHSSIALYYQQAVDSSDSGNGVNGSDAFHSDSGTPTHGTNGHWTRSISLNRLPPRSVVSYAPEEPLLPSRLSLGVAGEMINVYDLSRPGVRSRLVYTNCMYIGVWGVAGDGDANGSLPDPIIAGYDSGTFEFPVLDVVTEPPSRRVVLRRKRPGERSQLWYKSSQGFLVHEGSVAPQAPSSKPHRGRMLSTRSSWVLDIDTSEMAVREAMIQCGLDPSQTLENFEVGILCLARLSPRRKNTQTWNFDRGFFINAASFCIQAERSTRGSRINSADAVFVARPRIRALSQAVSGGRSLASKSLGVAKIFHSWLRPGSGSLQVEIVTEGPIRVLKITDPQEVPSQQSISIPTEPTSRSSTPPTSMRFVLDLPYGLAISIISARNEELCYASLLGLRFAVKRFYPGCGGQKMSTSASPIDIGQEVAESEEFVVEEDDDDDTVFVEDASEPPSQIPSIEDDSLTPFITACRPVEQVRLCLGRIQIDNQIVGACLPVIIFRAAPKDSSKFLGGIVEGRALRASDGGEWVQGRELERLFFRARGDTKAGTSTISGQSASMNYPSVVMQSIRLLHTGWKAEIFASMELRINRMVIQAEERLLLKLIQFSRNFRGSAPSSAILSTEDAKSIDFLNQVVLEAEGSYSRQVVPPIITSRNFVYLDRLRVFFAPIRVTIHTAEGRLGPEFYDVQRLLPKLMSFTDADLRLGEFARGHCLESAGFLMEQLRLHFETKLRAQALKIFGSVDMLGNPLGLMSDLSSGISDLADMDIPGMVRNVAHGVGDSTAKVVGTVSQLLHALSMDEQHQRRRMAIMSSPSQSSGSVRYLASTSNSSSSNRGIYATEEAEENLEEFELTAMSSESGKPRMMDGLAIATKRIKDSGDMSAPLRAGLRGFVHGMVGGVTSIVTQPIHGACGEDSFKGFVYGVGRGLLGTVTKPVGGVLDLVSGAMTSLREAARPSSSGRPLRMRPRRALANPLRAYSLAEAVGQLFLSRVNSVHRLNSTLKSQTSAVVSLEDLNGLSQGFSVSRLLKASGQQFEDDPPEVVIRVCKCQSAGVSVVVTNRAVWCLRNFSLAGLRLVSNTSFVNENRNATNVMFVIPYIYLNGLCLSDRGPVALDVPQSQALSTMEFPRPENSYYVEFLLEKGRRNLRFDDVAWAQEMISEVAEAHFRFVQSVMELRRDGPINTSLRTHPLALPFAPSLVLPPEPVPSCFENRES